MDKIFDSEPKTLADAIRYFSDSSICLQTMINLRWKNGVCCPTCGDKSPRFLTKQQRWECKNKHSKRQFSAKTGTIFEDSPLGLDKWFIAIWLLSNCRNGISSLELHRSIGVTQKTAWFMLHRIRLAMKSESIEKSDDTAEADETFIGGKAKNMHKDKREKKVFGRGGAGSGKQVVMGILSRGSGTNKSRIVSAKMIKDTTHDTLKAEIKKSVETGTKIYTDSHKGYRGLITEYVHAVVDHAVEYVNGLVHTNGMENFWSVLKRSIKGTYLSVMPPHLDRYVDEHVYRFNVRDERDCNRFYKVLGMGLGKRIMYAELIGREKS